MGRPSASSPPASTVTFISNTTCRAISLAAMAHRFRLFTFPGSFHGARS